MCLTQRLQYATTLSRQSLAKIDRRILSELNHEEELQLVKVPVSEAAWSTWHRYCEAVGIPMGRALAILLYRELGSVVDEDLDRVADMLGDRSRRFNEREAALDERERELEQRDNRVSAAEKQVACAWTMQQRPKPTTRAVVVLKAGRDVVCRPAGRV